MAMKCPKNFSWVVENELAAMGWPSGPEHIRYLIDIGIKHLVTCSPEKLPPVYSFPEIGWTNIKIREFFAPTIPQIDKFISICKKAREKNEVRMNLSDCLRVTIDLNFVMEQPRNFSWVVDSNLAAMGWPSDTKHIKFLINKGIKHLVTLSPDEMPPNMHVFPDISWTLIKIREFFAPTVVQMQMFIDICEQAREKNEAVGVHCWMGRGRTGVMLACYMVRFYDMAPEQAITHIRKMRPASVETYDQERAVVAYNDYLCSIRD